MNTRLISLRILTVAAAVAVILLRAPGQSSAQTAEFLHEQYDGNRDNYEGTIGGGFRIGSSNVVVSHLGFYSTNLAGLNRTHNVGIFNGDLSTLLGSVQVPAGVGPLVTNGYSWVALNPPLLLSNGTYYVLATEVFNGDGDGWADSFSPTNWNAYFIGTNQSQCAAYYSPSGATWPTAPANHFGSGVIYGAMSLALIPVGPPLVGTPVTSVTGFRAQPLSVPVAANGQYPLGFQWYKTPDTLLAGQTNSSLVLSSPEVTDSGTYYLVVSNELNTAQSGNISVTILADSPVSVGLQPTNATVLEKYPAAFSVTATGTTPIYYQWLRNNSAINGATNRIYQIPAASLANNGDAYSCVVSNVANSTAYSQTSHTATLTVIPNQALPTQVLHETRNGNRNDFTGTVGGLFTVGATDALATHLGYYCTNTAGLNLDHHVGVFTADGNTLLGSVTVPSGTTAYRTNGYLWVALDPPLLLAHNTSYILAAEVNAGDGDAWPDAYQPSNWAAYYVGANDGSTRHLLYGTAAWPTSPNGATSWGGGYMYGAPNLALLPINGPTVLNQATNLTLYEGQDATISAQVNGQPPLTVQWYKAPGTFLSGQTGTSLTLSNLSTAASGDYYLLASNTLAQTQGGNVTLNVLPLTAPVIVQPPQPQTVYIQQPATFSVEATGSPTFTYQWSYGGKPIDGATNRAFTVANAQTSDQGTYSVAVGNDLGTTPGGGASLTVLSPPPGSYAAAALSAMPLVYYEFSDADNGTPPAFNLGSLGAAYDGTYEGGYYGIDGPQPPAQPQFSSTNLAVALNGADTDVEIPPLNLDTSSGPHMTIAAWIYTFGPQVPYTGILFQRGPDGASGLAIELNDTGQNLLSYDWQSTHYTFNSGLVIPDYQWCFAALVVQPDQATLYLQNGTNLLSAANLSTHGQSPWAGTAYVGWDNNGGSTDRRFLGEIDEPMIFNRALTKSEITDLYNGIPAPPTVSLSISHSGNNVILSWPSGKLQQADNVAGPYGDLINATSPYTNSVTATNRFYRVHVQ